MANKTNKTYSVMKNGEEIEKLKTLAAAKKLADAEDGNVFCDGECVYQSNSADNQIDPENTITETAGTETTEIITAEPIIAEVPKQPEVADIPTERYRLKALMNVRKKPSLDAVKITTKAAGSIVRVLAVENGWLHLTDDTYILYENGKFAEKVI